jgi:DNA-binding MarR family transcriptional regulator
MRNKYPIMTSSTPRLVFLLNAAQRRLQQLVTAEQLRLTTQALDAPTPAQGGLLFALHTLDGQTMGELSLALDLAPSAVTGLVQRTESQGWVIRATGDQDGRTQRVWLQPAGRALIPHLRGALKRINSRITHGFTPEELAVVGRWLGHVQQCGNPPETP